MIDKEAKEYYERIAQALERIADALDKMTEPVAMLGDGATQEAISQAQAYREQNLDLGPKE